LKIGFYSWNEITWLPDQIRWLGLNYARIGGALSDKIMTICSNENIEVLYTASPLAPRIALPNDTEFIDGFLHNIDEALTKYGPDGSFWKSNPDLKYVPVAQVEIGNEPNYGYGFSGTQTEIAALYAKVLTAAYRHIKQTWPSVTVVGISAGGASATAPAFVSAVLAELKAADQLDSFDVVSIHSYMGGSPPDQPITEDWGTWNASQKIDEVRQLMARYGIDKPLWITESGYSISQAEGGRYPDASAKSGIPAFVSPQQQAAYSIRLNMAAVRFGASRVYHFFVLDTDGGNAGWFDNSADHKARLVGIAMRQLNLLISGATKFEILLDGNSTDGAFAYRFTTPRGWTIVAWSERQTQASIPLDSATQSTVIDMLGSAISTVATGNVYLANLSEQPIFITQEK